MRHHCRTASGLWATQWQGENAIIVVCDWDFCIGVKCMQKLVNADKSAGDHRLFHAVIQRSKRFLARTEATARGRAELRLDPSQTPATTAAATSDIQCFAAGSHNGVVTFLELPATVRGIFLHEYRIALANCISRNSCKLLSRIISSCFNLPSQRFLFFTQLFSSLLHGAEDGYAAFTRLNKAFTRLGTLSLQCYRFTVSASYWPLPSQQHGKLWSVNSRW